MKETYLAVTGRIRRELQELAQVVERQVEVLVRQLQPTMEQCRKSCWHLPTSWKNWGLTVKFERC